VPQNINPETVRAATGALRAQKRKFTSSQFQLFSTWQADFTAAKENSASLKISYIRKSIILDKHIMQKFCNFCSFYL